MIYKVIKVIDPYTIVINGGMNSDLDFNDEFTIYGVEDEPTLDPETKEDLGYLKYPKGNAVVIDIQEKMAILQSSEFIITTRKEKVVPSVYDKLINPIQKIKPHVIEYDEKKRLPFKNPQIGDIVEPK